MASTSITYRVETTEFPGADVKVDTYSEAAEVAKFVRGLRPADRVLFVAALDLAEGVDYGNFYLFTSTTGSAHVMLHEHREFLPHDPATPDGADATFLDEDGSTFAVPRTMTMPFQRGIAALEYWLPRQERWAELKWE